MHIIVQDQLAAAGARSRRRSESKNLAPLTAGRTQV